ncbi:hypothetical protein K7X08_003377 [Anisodus acutangulus]|uniref:Uncharacterized protein n=1 Tax=Anisodus acutangulus TaxID=402998 RepID=A0A9Q1RJ31_9SOLA|nr:hypothetical protein K7X08_003377 [Anisodus acutangulus]
MNAIGGIVSGTRIHQPQVVVYLVMKRKNEAYGKYFDLLPSRCCCVSSWNDDPIGNIGRNMLPDTPRNIVRPRQS